MTGGNAGLTGTRGTLTAFQRAFLLDVLTALLPDELHYGDCTGADYEGYLFCMPLRIRTVCHPPDNPAYRMFTVADEERDMQPYLARNRAIVDETSYLIACPKEEEEVRRSGTWATVRYARGLGRPVILLYPDGRVDNPFDPEYPDGR